MQTSPISSYFLYLRWPDTIYLREGQLFWNQIFSCSTLIHTFIQIIPQGWLPRGRCDKSSRAEFQNSMWYCFVFSTKWFSEQFGWAANEWPEFAALFLKSVLSEYGKIWSGALLLTVLWVLTTVLWNKTKRAKNWAKPGKQHGCHNFYRQGVLSLYCIMSRKPFLIALTLIHKLQDIFTFVPLTSSLPRTYIYVLPSVTQQPRTYIYVLVQMVSLRVRSFNIAWVHSLR